MPTSQDQVFYSYLLEPNYTNPNNSDELVACSEVKRLGEYFEQLEGTMLGGRHPCVLLTKQCLHNNPSRRPTAEQLVVTLEGMRADIEGPYGAVARADAVRQVVTMKMLRNKEVEEDKKTSKLTEEIQRLQSQLESKELEIQQKDAELGQKAVEFDRIHAQLSQLQGAFQAAATDPEKKALKLRENDLPHDPSSLKLSDLKSQLNATWERGQDMPLALDSYPTAAILNGKVYVGGGGGAMMGHYVTVYDVEKDNWTVMPPYSFYWFSLAALSNQLVLVGGVGSSSERTNIIGVWEDTVTTSNWTHPFPPMPTARSGAMVLTWRNRWLIVAGGYSNDKGRTSAIEIFDIVTPNSDWYRARRSSLPIPASKMSSAVIKDTWYLLGGFNVSFADQAFCIDINDLIVHSISQPSIHSQPVQWLSIPSPPVYLSAALAFNEHLFALGGSQDCFALYLYQPSKEEAWIRVGVLPSPRSECVCVVLPNGKVLVAGGNSDSEQVDIGTFTCF